MNVDIVRMDLFSGLGILYPRLMSASIDLLSSGIIVSGIMLLTGRILIEECEFSENLGMGRMGVLEWRKFAGF